MQTFDLVVIGQGYAGLKAASLAAARGLKAATVEAMFPGGLVMSINELHPAPEGESAEGPDLTGSLAMENMDTSLVNISGEVSALSRSGDSWLIEADEAITSKNVIIASGARLRKLGVPGEAEFEGRGVSACADCDGPIFMGKDAVVVGGGDSAFQEALALTHYAAKVTIIMRGATPRANADLIAAVTAHDAIEVLAEHTVTAVLGDTGVTSVKLAAKDGTASDLPCSVVFAFIGLDPVTNFLPGDVARDSAGAIMVDGALSAGQPGLWAIGAVRNGFGGLLSDAADDARKVIAAL